MAPDTGTTSGGTRSSAPRRRPSLNPETTSFPAPISDRSDGTALSAASRQIGQAWSLSDRYAAARASVQCRPTASNRQSLRPPASGRLAPLPETVWKRGPDSAPPSGGREIPRMFSPATDQRQVLSWPDRKITAISRGERKCPHLTRPELPSIGSPI